MNARALILAAIAAAAIAFGVILLSSGARDETSIRIVVPSALGLRDDSEVRVGGVPVGQVRHLGLTPSDDVELDLGVRNDAVTVGDDASVTIKSLNLLGEKYLELDPGTPSAAHPQVVTIPASRVTPATDLDQVLNVLDSDTRARLAVLINEAGIGLAGRHADLNALLERLPPSLENVTALLNDVVSDNHTLADVIAHSDRFLAAAVQKSDDLGRFVDSAKGAAQTFGQSEDDLAATLAAAPAGLSELRSFLADLRQTAPPLGRAARRLSATAPHLDDTLEQLRPFRNAIQPTLHEAQAVAPSLSKLGEDATPVIRASDPTLGALDDFANSAKPLTKVLGGTGMPDLLGLLEGWGRSIQGRDGLSHQFHGRASFGADALRHMLALPSAKKKSKPAQTKAAASSVGASAGSGGQRPASGGQEGGLKGVTDKVKGLVGGTLDKVKKAADRLGSKVKSTTDPVKKALDFLVGP